MLVRPRPFFIASDNSGNPWFTYDLVNWVRTTPLNFPAVMNSGNTDGFVALTGASFSFTTDGVTYSSGTLPGSAPSVTPAVSRLPNSGLYVAYDYTDGYAWTSANGTTWAQTTGLLSGGNVIFSCSGNAKCLFTVSGSNTPVLTSNGTTFAFGGSSGVSNGIGGIAYGLGIVAVVGGGSVSTGTAYSSNDGTTWTAGAAAPFNVGKIAFNKQAGRFLICNSSNNGAYSSSATLASWTSATMPVSGANLDSFSGLFLAYTASTTYYTSPDGVNWTSRTAPFTFANTFGSSLQGY